MLAAEYFAARRAQALGERSAISWTVAILVGIAQVVAGVFPGTSRSAATIFVALLFGTSSRVAATEFAFLVGIPTMFAATGYELLKSAQRRRRRTRTGPRWRSPSWPRRSPPSSRSNGCCATSRRTASPRSRLPRRVGVALLLLLPAAA